MKMTLDRWIALWIGAALLSCHATPAEAEPRELSEAEAVATFEEAWQVIHETHFDTEFNGVDWEALRVELLPEVRAARSEAELRRVLGDMLGRLGQSHFALIPRQARPAEQGDDAVERRAGGLGFDLRYREGQLLVSRVDPGGPAHRAGVHPGWILSEIEGQRVEEWKDPLGAAKGLGERALANRIRRRAEGLLYGSLGEELELTFQDASDDPLQLTLAREQRQAVAHSFGDLPTFYLRFESRDLDHASGKSFGLIHFSNWFLPMVKPIDEAIDRMRGRDGIVLDLRGNSGGAGAMTMGTAGHFFEQRAELGVQELRGSEMKFMAMPRLVNASGQRVTPFQGPVAVLVDETTGSASEIFAGGMQSAGRVRVFGETSAGAVLPARTTVLPNGDSLLHALGDFVTSDGTRLEGRGVVPDEEIVLTRADLLAGRDAALERALDWMASQP